MNPEFKELADDIYRRRVLRARAMTPGERMLEGMRLWDGVVKRMTGGIKHQYPKADAAEVDQILVRRLRRLRQVSDRGFIVPLSAAS